MIKTGGGWARADQWLHRILNCSSGKSSAGIAIEVLYRKECTN